MEVLCQREFDVGDRVNEENDFTLHDKIKLPNYLTPHGTSTGRCSIMRFSYHVQVSPITFCFKVYIRTLVLITFFYSLNSNWAPVHS